MKNFCNYSAGGSKGPCRPLGELCSQDRGKPCPYYTTARQARPSYSRGTPCGYPGTLPTAIRQQSPQAAQEKGDLNSYVYKFLRIMTPKLPMYAEQCMICFSYEVKKSNVLCTLNMLSSLLH